MPKIFSTLSRSLSFAHLGGVSARADAGGDDDEDDKKKDAKGPKADDEDDGDKDKKPKDDDKSAKGNDAAAEDDKKDGDEDDGEKKSKKAKAKADDEEASDDDSDEEMHGKSAAAAARRRERARCAAIFGSKAAARNTALAARLAFNTTMTRDEAIEVLEGTPAAASNADRQNDRAARNPNVTPNGGQGAGGKPTGAQLDQSWDKAFASIGGHGDKRRARH